MKEVCESLHASVCTIDELYYDNEYNLNFILLFHVYVLGMMFPDLNKSNATQIGHSKKKLGNARNKCQKKRKCWKRDFRLCYVCVQVRVTILCVS